MKNENLDDLLVVSIGASAGGIRALKNFFANYHSVNSAAVIIQHMNVESKEMLKEVVHQFSELQVLEAISDDVLLPRKIYICPPHKLVSVKNNKFHIQELEDETQKYTIIDFFMHSLAEELKDRSIGVLLSGEGMDGVRGLKAISDAGGITFVQDEKSAEHPSLPKAAIDMGFVDHVLAPEKMGQELYTHENFVIKLEKNRGLPKLKEEIGAAVNSICDILYRHTHHDFKHYKTSTMSRRIQRRMAVLHVDKVEEYVNTLNLDKLERSALFNDLLINVTSFFRDPEAFEALKHEVLIPSLSKFTGSKKYRVWVAGCSTGEEPYSLAMLIREVMEELQVKFEVQIIATDIDEEALNIARCGDYPLSISERISPQRIEKFFTRRNGRYSVTKQLREMILFSSHNVINDPPFSQLDLISCRNVLIYLGPHLQKKLIPVFHYSLKPNGYLFLGTSEALTSHKDLFHSLNAKFRIAQRKATVIPTAPAQTFFTAMSTSYTGHFKDAPQSHEEDLHLVGQRIVLDEFSPRFAIISEEGKILSVSAGLEEYMEPSEGAFQNNIIKLVKQNLRSPLRISINDARKEKRQIQNQSAIIRTAKGLSKIGLVVQPMPQLGEHSGLYMVVFRDLGYVVDENVTPSPSGTVDAGIVEELERELNKLRDELEHSVQDLEASNEELKSSNEELLSMNEELQSTNEELEVSKEEVQKVNEILINSNVDLENLLNSTKIATIFLDEKLSIKNFTPAINQIYDLIPQDVGRSILSFSSKAANMPTYSYPKDLKIDQVVETEVTMPDGRIFLRRKSPYVNSNKEMIGLVVTFVDVTELRRSEMLFKSLANSVPQMIFSTDEKGNYNYFSEQWFAYTGIDPATVRNLGFRDIVHPDDLQGAMTAWGEAHKGKDVFSHQYRLKNRHGQYRWHQVNARSVKDHHGNIYRWFGGCTDIQDQKEMELDLFEKNRDIVRTQERFNGVARAIDLGVWYCNLPFDVLNWSDNVKTQFWCDVNEVITIKLFYERIHPDDRQRTEDAINDSIENHKHYDINYRTVSPTTGKIKWIRAIGWTDYDESGKPIRFDGVTFDITEATFYMDNLRDSEWRYSMASKAAREVIWDWDFSTNGVHWNEAIVTQLGYPEKFRDTTALWWLDQIHPEDLDRVSHGIHEAIDSGEAYWQDEYRFLKFDGTYATVKDQGYIQRDESHKPMRMIGTMYDTTEQNSYLEKMKEAVKTRDEFLSIASHELKTPLTSMILKMQMLQRKIEKGQGDMGMVVETNKLLLKQCGTLASLIDDMLDVSRIANGKMNFNFQQESLQSVVMNAIDSFSINIEEKNIEIKTDIKDDVVVMVDPFRLEQVVSNLLSNAIKYGQGKPIKIKVLKVGEFGVIEVVDEGLGISPGSIDKIFNLFERAIASVNISGMGLGLYISKQIIDAHAGEIQVESSLGKGSTFRVLIPIIPRL